jgi:hypothetical protein
VNFDFAHSQRVCVWVYQKVEMEGISPFRMLCTRSPVHCQFARSNTLTKKVLPDVEYSRVSSTEFRLGPTCVQRHRISSFTGENAHRCTIGRSNQRLIFPGVTGIARTSLVSPLRAIAADAVLLSRHIHCPTCGSEKRRETMISIGFDLAY